MPVVNVYSDLTVLLWQMFEYKNFEEILAETIF